MKIINKTHYDTEALRKLMTSCVREVRRVEGKSWNLRTQDIYIRYKRKGQYWVGGYAYYDSKCIVMKVPKTWTPDPGQDSYHQDFSWKFADTFIHEIGHNLGYKHRRVEGNKLLCTIEHRYQDWLKANIDSTRFPLPVKGKEKTKKEDVLAKRYQKSLKAQIKAQRRFKLAKTLLGKWTAKVKYYEKSYQFAKPK